MSGRGEPGPLAAYHRSARGSRPLTEPSRTPFDPSAIRAVAFDAYGTLFQFHDAEFRVAVSTVLEQQGLTHDDHEELFKTWYGAFGPVGPWGHLFHDGKRPDRASMVEGPLPEFITQWEWWRRQWAATFEALRLEGDPTAASDYLRDLLTNTAAYPDAAETLDALASQGLLVALLSNADDDFLHGAVTRGRLRFSVIHSSQALRAYKPHGATFAALATSLGCDPAHILYVGDSGYSDVHGATSAGLRTVWVRRSERPYPEEMPAPDVEVQALSEIVDLFDA